jgi:GAF domain-containing protein
MVVHDDIVIGALTVGFVTRRALADVDLAFIQAAAELCGQAVHRARLAELRRRDLVRQSLGARVTDLLAAELDFDRTLHEVARLAVAELADVCALCLLDDDGLLRPVAALHHDPAGQQVLDQLVARQPVVRNPHVLEVVRTCTAMIVTLGDPAVRAASAEDEAHLQLLQALDATSAIIVPMVARGTVAGALVLAMTAGSRTMDAEDQRVAEQLASWSALAIDNARLYAEQVELVGHLERALQSHKAIEQAKGVLVHRWDLTPSEAFDRLRRHARSTRRKIEEVAADVVAGRDDLPAPDLVM